MKITVKVIPKSSKCEVLKTEDGDYKVKLTAAPEQGKANKQLVDVLSKHFGVSKNKVIICAGHKSKSKIVEILDQ